MGAKASVPDIHVVPIAIEEEYVGECLGREVLEVFEYLRFVTELLVT